MSLNQNDFVSDSDIKLLLYASNQVLKAIGAEEIILISWLYVIHITILMHSLINCELIAPKHSEVQTGSVAVSQLCTLRQGSTSSLQIHMQVNQQCTN